MKFRAFLPIAFAAAVSASGALPGFTQSTARAPQTAANAGPSRFLSSRMAQEADRYYQMVWGVESLNAKVLESGELIRFSYTVVDAAKAKTLNDKKLAPSLEAPRAGVKLVVPQLEMVGMLRQSMPPEDGKTYWIAFSNKGGVVKKGDRVDILIGSFRAEGLIVQ